MTACCARRRDDGILDRREIENAMDGRAARLSPREARIAIWQLTCKRQWGPGRIAQQLGYSKSQVAATLADIRAKGGQV